MSDPTTAATSLPSRSVRLRSEMVALFEELSGLQLHEVDATATFLEMGFDSLFLTQITQSLRTRFGVKIAFRQLLDTESTFDALVGYMDNKLPPDGLVLDQVAPPNATQAAAPPSFAAPIPVNTASAFSQAQPMAGAVTASRVTSASDSQPMIAGVESLLREQLRIMSQQLDVLRNLGAGSPQAPELRTQCRSRRARRPSRSHRHLPRRPSR